MKWEAKLIKELVDINDKNIGKNLENDYINYLDTGNITEGILGEIKYISKEDKIPSRAKRIVKKEDIIISTVRPNQKHYGIVKWEIENLIVSTGFCVLSPKKNIINPNFLYKYLTMEEITNYFHQIASTSVATYPTMKADDVGNLKIIIPSLETQTKIANILSKYDDLIENNLKRIELLEEAAQRLYKEWFIDLRFPGYEKVQIVDGIPEGWEKKKIKDICDFKNGYAYKSKDWKREGLPVIKIKNLQNNTINFSEEEQYISEELAKKTEEFKLETMDIIIAMTGATVGKMALIPEKNIEYHMNQRVGKFISKNLKHTNLFVLLFLTSDYGKNKIINLALGAAQPNISSTDIINIDLLVPNEIILKKFLNIVFKNYKLISKLYFQNQKLTEARDRLLPKLMKGEIEI